MSTSSSRPPFLRSLSTNSVIRPSKHKPRLYIVLYPRGGSTTTSSFRNDINCDSHHWSLVVGSQSPNRKDPGTRYHVEHLDHDAGKYLYDQQDVPTHPSAQAGLVRIAIAKVTNEARLQSILRDIVVPQEDVGFNCLTWVRDAFVRLHQDRKSIRTYLDDTDWPAVETCARKYCKRKKDVGRFQEDRRRPGTWNPEKISTFNFWENRETCP
ncbi:hypothetical protein PV10_01389 [Exophiala mesophila]|uniref:Uncharacterized protein n=1 Tax=Exophiala mesophila TaxID=212818 RepID=A0A0D2AFJ9_EXOME|nr:uncharacterized protein PV10_01389 [Exophiala mesophila]KIV97673.1 hypothetical protein PV10_01389 [Exophiala mesophila]